MMDTGRKLDALIAEKVMGWQWWQHSPNQVALPGYSGNNPRFLGDPAWITGLGPDPSWVIVPAVPDAPESEYDNEMIPHYSTNIAIAWQVVEAMKARNDYRAHIFFHLLENAGCWLMSAAVVAQTICLAALKAIGIDT